MKNGMVNKTPISKFIRINEVSVYNRNYYHYDGKLILGVSDDDAGTEWYEINGKYTPRYIGHSDIRDEPEVLIISDKEHN